MRLALRLAAFRVFLAAAPALARGGGATGPAVPGNGGGVNPRYPLPAPQEGAAVRPDSPLTLTFAPAPAPPPTLGAGKISIHGADGALIEAIDVAARGPAAAPAARGLNLPTLANLPVRSKTIGGITGYNYYPILINRNQVTITLAKPLPYNQSFQVDVDPGAFKVGGTDAAGIANWRFTTAAHPPAADASRLIVGPPPLGDFATIQAALDFIPAGNTRPITVLVRAGVYTEMVVLADKHNITLLGEDRKTTILQYPDNANFNPAGSPYRRGMFLAQRCNNLVLANMTLRNTTPQGGSQAEALIFNGTATARAIVANVDLYSYQDTLQINGQAYIADSAIEGDVDFMWGTGPCFFENCTAKALRKNAYYTQIRNTAANHGYVFNRCVFDAAAEMTGNYLARIEPTRFPNSEVVLLDCTFPKVAANGATAISDVAWKLDPPAPAAPGAPAASAPANLSSLHFWELSSRDAAGQPLDTSRRLSAAKQLDPEVDAATIANYRNPAWVLGGGWTPSLAPVIASPNIFAGGDQPLALGEKLTLHVTAVGVPTPSYQWQKDGADIPGATAATLTFERLSQSDAGAYGVLVKNTAGETKCQITALQPGK